MFKTIEKQGGSGGPQWLSDHPNPGNRYDYITKEAQTLQVDNPLRDTRAFDQVQAHLKQMPRRRPRKKPLEMLDAGRAPTLEMDPPATYRQDASHRPRHVTRRMTKAAFSRQRPVELARTAGQRRGHVYAGRRIRHLQRAGRLHARHTNRFDAKRNRTTCKPRQTSSSTRSRVATPTWAGRRATSGFRSMAIGRCGRRFQIETRPRAIPRQSSWSPSSSAQAKCCTWIGVAPSVEFNNYRGVFNRIIDSVRLTD